MHMAVPPYDEDEIAHLKEHHPEVHEDHSRGVTTRVFQFSMTQSDEVPCFFFDTIHRTCRHHDHRPDICRQFEVGGESCLDMRSTVGLTLIEEIPEWSHDNAGSQPEEG